MELESEQSAEGGATKEAGETKAEAEAVMPGADPSVTLESEAAAEVAALRDDAAGAAASGDEAACLEAIAKAKARLEDPS